MHNVNCLQIGYLMLIYELFSLWCAYKVWPEFVPICYLTMQALSSHISTTLSNIIYIRICYKTHNLFHNKMPLPMPNAALPIECKWMINWIMYLLLEILWCNNSVGHIFKNYIRDATAFNINALFLNGNIWTFLAINDDYFFKHNVPSHVCQSWQANYCLHDRSTHNKNCQQPPWEYSELIPF